MGFLYQTAVGRFLEELAANNSYHLLEAVGEKEQLFTKSVRFKKLIYVFSIQKPYEADEGYRDFDVNPGMNTTRTIHITVIL